MRAYISEFFLKNGSLIDEFVTEAMDGLDKLRVTRIFFKFLPQPCNVNIDRSRRRHRVVTPNCIEKIVAGMHDAAIFDQVLQ